MPLELNLVPARRQESRDISVSVEGRLLFKALRGEAEAGIVIEETKPLIAEVSIRDESSISFSCFASRERNLMRGFIMYEFQRKPSSRLSTSNADCSDDLFLIRVNDWNESTFRTCFASDWSDQSPHYSRMSHCLGSSSAHDMDAQKLDLDPRDRGQGSLVSKGRSLHGARNHISPYLGKLEVILISN